MYDPPPGYDDLLADAETGPPLGGEGIEVEVDGIGPMKLYRPRPASIAALAMATNRRLGQADQTAWLNRFAAAHMHPDTGGFGELMRRLVVGEYPADAAVLVVKAAATIGTARKFEAVIALAGIAGHHWRAVRYKLLTAGVTDPMRLPSMHVVLDVTEGLAVESMSDGTKEGKRKLEQFFDDLYRPVVKSRATADDGWRPPPVGFDADDIAEVSRLSGIES